MGESTLTVLKEIQEQALKQCTQCLRDHIADNSAVLGDLLEIASNMAAIRDTSTENAELYERAFAELMSAVMLIAVFTAELTKRPAPFAVAISPN